MLLSDAMALVIVKEHGYVPLLINMCTNKYMHWLCGLVKAFVTSNSYQRIAQSATSTRP